MAFSTIVTVDGFEFTSSDEVARFSRLIEEFRCPQCLNTNLAGSDAPIAMDLRRTIYELMTEGKTDREIRDYLRERYGDFILFQPRFTPKTLILWLLPVVLCLIASLLVLQLRRSKLSESLTMEELAQVEKLMGSK
ncbi:MAG: cytochrome c-type biogenesis protein CcmH [Gammaproteobacteria bacterium]|nr:cytochrome c-type biogenesis protein CcmH [Gammaproteobacteria bacterium]